MFMSPNTSEPLPRLQQGFSTVLHPRLWAQIQVQIAGPLGPWELEKSPASSLKECVCTHTQTLHLISESSHTWVE